MGASLRDYAEIQRLRKLIEQAKQLGFWDDVKHWEAELKKLGVNS